MKTKLSIYFLPVLFSLFLILGYSSQDNPYSDENYIDTKIQQQVNEMTSMSPKSLPSEIQLDNSAIVPDSICYKGPIPAYPDGCVGIASNWLGDTLYVAGGSANSFPSMDVYRYSITSDSWSTGVSMPVEKSVGSLVKCGNALYYIGGSNGFGTPTANTLRYRVGLGWDEVAPIPTPVEGNAGACWGDSVIYCIMGGWTQYYRSVQIYRPSTDTWSRGSDSVPSGAGRRTFAGGIVGNKIYAASGWSGAARKDMYIGTIGANGNTITWALGPQVPCRGTGMSRSGGVGIDGHFYVIAGQTFPDPQQQDSIFIFNTTSGTWQTPLSGRGTGAAANYWGVVSAKDIGGKINIFIPGGSITGATTFGLYVARSGGCDLTTGISNLNLEIPNEYSLSQNYPNPFNPATKINFSIPVNGLVTLKIYNVLGKEVMTLINEHKPAGNYGAEFNGANLSSGIYFFRMETGEFVDVKRMMLIK